ncbi:MAG: helix-turn-helix domain-containing protein [Bacteroidia bacterium]
MLKIEFTGFNELEAKLTCVVENAALKGIEKLITEVIKSYNREYFTRKEASAYLKMSLVSLDKATKEGVIESYRIQGSILYLKSDLDNCLTKRFFGHGK